MTLTRSSLLFLLALVLPISVSAADTFIFSAPNKSITVGDSFSVLVSASSPAQAMNAVSGTLQVSGGMTVTGISKNGSIVDFWTAEPRIVGNQIRFEGVVLNPGYQGSQGALFTISLSARKEGIGTLSFLDGALLANDGLGSNIMDGLASRSIKIGPAVVRVDAIPPSPIASLPVGSKKTLALPVITEYPTVIPSEGRVYIKGKGEPYAITNLIFKNTSLKSLGEQFIDSVQSKRTKPTEALVKNDKDGFFQYFSASNLVAGAYNVTPYLVDEDEQTQKPGFGVQVLVSNSKLVKGLVVFINILALLIPVVCLGVIIYFIPWYSRLRMKILGHKIKLEDEALNLSEKELKRKEELIGKV